MSPKQKRLLTRIIVALVIFFAIIIVEEAGLLRAAFGSPGDVWQRCPAHSATSSAVTPSTRTSS